MLYFYAQLIYSIIYRFVWRRLGVKILCGFKFVKNSCNVMSERQNRQLKGAKSNELITK